MQDKIFGLPIHRFGKEKYSETSRFLQSLVGRYLFAFTKWRIQRETLKERGGVEERVLVNYPLPPPPKKLPTEHETVKKQSCLGSHGKESSKCFLPYRSCILMLKKLLHKLLPSRKKESHTTKGWGKKKIHAQKIAVTSTPQYRK